MAEEDEIRQNLESIGEAAVRDNLGQRRYSGKKLLVAQQWLADLDRTRQRDIDKKEDDRADEALRVARSSRRDRHSA